MTKAAAVIAVVLASGAGAALVPSVGHACGGCFGPRESEQVVTDHRMVMAVHASESILWDQIRYTGAPQDFSWVLPVSGSVTIEVASGDFFDALDGATAVTVQGPVVRTSCNNGRGFGFTTPSAALAGTATDAPPPAVTVIQTAVVGPYQTVTLRSTDATALTAWLASNSYVIPPSIQPVIDYYVGLHMDFVALRLAPGQGVQAMQPIRIRYATPNMVLPLRMVAAGVADKVGISLWVFGYGRYETTNFGNDTIDPTQLVWDWDTGHSNYDALFTSTLQGLNGGRAWITEYAQESAQLQYQFGNNNPSMLGTAAADWALATENNATGMWVTRLRTNLLASFLDADLQLQASASSQAVSNILSATRQTGTNPAAVCPSTTVLNAGPGTTVACHATPGRPGSQRGTWVVFGLLAGATAWGVGRRGRR